MRVIFYALLAALPVLVPAVIQAQQQIQTPFRPPVAFTDELPAPPIPADVTDDRRVARNYPEQPPVIPHNIRDYQLNLNTNRCLTCHSRKFTEVVQAPMISVTHYMTREGQMLADVSPRRYFCTACHVPQADIRPLVENKFVDMSELGVDHAGDK